MIGLAGYILHSSCCVLLILMAGKRPGKRLDESRLRAGFVSLKNH